MSRQIGYSTGGFHDRCVESALDAIAELGFDLAEILCEEPHLPVAPTGRRAEAFGKRLARRGLGVTLHAPLGCHVPDDPDEAMRPGNVAVLASYLRFGAAIGAGHMVVHPLTPFFAPPDPRNYQSPERMVDGIRRSMDDLLTVSRDTAVRILLENLPQPSPLPLRTMGPLRQFVQDYPPELVGLVVDVGHAATLGFDPAAEIRAAGDRLWGTHLQDVDTERPEDNHWIPTHGGLDWRSIRAALADVRYAGPWTFEVVNARHGETSDQLCELTRAVAAGWSD